MRYAWMIVTHTPAWVFAGLAYFIWIGIKGLGVRTLPLARVWLTPAIFILLSLSSLFGGAALTLVAPAWIIGALLGVGPGALTAPRHIEYDRAARRVRFRGSPFPLIRNLFIFAARYALGVMTVTAAADHTSLALWSAGVSGASAGYFIGWGVMFLRRLGGAPATRLATA
ncbi:MAG: DUF6622 family protein [Caulobacteraceae bacterium]